MIVNTVFFDDTEYLIEHTGAVTRVTEDGAGLYCDLGESTAVTASQDDECDGADRRVA